MEVGREKLPNFGRAVTWKAWPSGPEIQLKRILRVDYDYRVDGHTQHTTVDPSHKEIPEFLGCGGVVTDGSPLRAIVWFNDGSHLALFHTLSPIEEGKVSGQPAELEVQLRERYWEIEAGKPTWSIRAELIGSAANLAKITLIDETIEKLTRE